MSLFRSLSRVWCDICDGRTLKIRTRHGVCKKCIDKELDRLERDAERKAIRFASDEALERF